jgi:uncharacterized protein (TIGR02246 family)
MNEADIDAIKSVREKTEAAENSGDAEFFLTYCSDDVIVMPPGMPVVNGPKAASEFMREFFRQFDFHIEYESEETQILGDTAFDRGTFFHRLTPRGGGEAVEEQGKFLWVYSRAPDGQWKMARVIWNTS